ncbi:hypothetical protein CerSpe_195050 [Prunus speciosa]
MAQQLQPGYYAIRSVERGRYLSCKPDATLRFDAQDVSNPNTRFQVEDANVNKHLVNIKSNNDKYWRMVDPTSSRIWSGAVDPHEDLCSWSCTLFKIMNATENNYRILQKHLENFIEPTSENDYNAYALQETLTNNQLVVFERRD